MFDTLYKRRLKQDLNDWVEKGLVSSQNAGQILTELEASDGRSRLPMVLAGIGIVCVALALAAFIAANWDGIPRMAKLTGIAVLVVGTHMLAAWAAKSGRKGVCDLATAFATLVFVGGMALVGQIFHLPSDWAGGSFLVCLGALAASWMTGSRASLLVAATAAILWQVGRSEIGEAAVSESLIGLALLVAIVLHPVAFPLRVSRWAATLLALTTYGRWLADTAETLGANDDLSLAMAALGFAGLAGLLIQTAAISDLFVKWSSDYPDRGHGRWLMLHSLQDTGFAILAALLVLTLVGSSELEDSRLAEAVMLAPVGAIILLSLVMTAAGFLLSFKTAKPRWLFGTALAGLVTVATPMLLPNIIVISGLSLGTLILMCMTGTIYNNAFWTLCGYGGLTAAFLWLLQVTIGSLLGQSLFFLVAGIVLLGMAFAATRFLRRQQGGAKA
ncbi:DUF2157 domain-containing protein [Roseibium hamelinense]|nr:DUF2157 domain-containing protein [Roseibium hamelinense]MTI44468.1 DUF2157 domain-containing protein [Roseibium hamelinense]